MYIQILDNLNEILSIIDKFSLYIHNYESGIIIKKGIIYL